MIAGFPFIASSFDPDARDFVTATGATDRAALNFFVKGIKRLGLWDDMVCWPLRSTQNAGTGSTAYSLGGLGTYNGTLVNGPTWGADGVNFNAVSATINVLSFPIAYGIIFSAATLNSSSDSGHITDLNSDGFVLYGSSNYIAFNGVELTAAHPAVGSHWISCVFNGASSTLIIDNSKTNGTTGTKSHTSPTFRIGNNFATTNGNKNITIPLVGFLSGVINYPDKLALLYKSTLGQGLSLP